MKNDRNDDNKKKEDKIENIFMNIMEYLNDWYEICFDCFCCYLCAGDPKRQPNTVAVNMNTLRRERQKLENMKMLTEMIDDMQSDTEHFQKKKDILTKVKNNIRPNLEVAEECAALSDEFLEMVRYIADER